MTLGKTGKLAMLSGAALGVAGAITLIYQSFVWLAFGAAVQRLLGSERRLRIFNVAMGVLLALSIVLIVR